MSQQEPPPENPTTDSAPEAVSEQPPSPPRTPGRAARFVRHRATQLVAVAVLAVAIGGGVTALVMHEEGDSGTQQERHGSHGDDHESDHDNDHEGNDGNR